jgi:hypothetical protein
MQRDCCNNFLNTYVPPWGRVRLVDVVQDSFGQITYDDLRMRRKAEVLQYNKSQNKMTQKQNWAMLNKGFLKRKKGWAVQNYNVTNPNTSNLQFAENSNTVLVCNNNPNVIIKISSTASGVPGTPLSLYLDPNIPLVNYNDTDKTMK